ncbi:MAG: aminotransferase class I/II-fold pyridoxal phosphate-dependent enzyme, partial [Amylibacter sp.]|nr:aminotransferase class I/II-fold pyridoxal phosphate-dependent enzyme [Amylibacter sp.]
MKNPDANGSNYVVYLLGNVSRSVHNKPMTTNPLPNSDWPTLEQGWVWLCGAGPGDPGLLTLHALNALRQADVIVYDAESHACILDGVRLHIGKRYVYKHNDMKDLEKQLKRASKLVENTNGGIMVITEGVFGMSGNQGSLAEIVKLKDSYSFRLFVDDAHGFGTMGETGAGTGEAQNVQDGIDVY